MIRAFTHFTRAVFVICLVAASPAALAQTTQPGVGAEVRGPSGGLVGIVQSVEGDNYVVKTDKYEVRVGKSSFTPHEGAFLFGMTQQQLNAEFETALAAASANLAAGMTVQGSQGTPVGTIETLDDQFVTLKLFSGKLVKIARSGIAAGQQGAVIGMTAAELEAAVQ